MKKIYYVLALAAVVATAACSKDDNNPSKDELIGGKATDWFTYGLYGKPKKVVETNYSDVEADTNTMRAITPTASQLSYVSTVEFNGSGFITLMEDTEREVVSATAIASNTSYVRVTFGQKPSGKVTFTYDSKKRVTSQEMVEYDYSPMWGESEMYYSGDSAWVNDNTTGSFAVEVDSSFSKVDITYDKTTATVINSYKDDEGNWVEVEKEVISLNKYGFIDDNSTRESYRAKPAAFESKPYNVSYSDVDSKGNATLRYSIYYSEWNNEYRVEDYSTYAYTY